MLLLIANVCMMQLTVVRAKAQKHLAAATAAAAAPAATPAPVPADDGVGIGDPLKDRRRKVKARERLLRRIRPKSQCSQIANFARYLGIDPQGDGSLMWIAGCA